MASRKKALPDDYPEFLNELKLRIKARQLSAALAINRELIELYWEIGQQIVQRQESSEWGDSILSQIERDLKQDLPNIKGFSRRNLYRMRLMYLTYRDQGEFVPQAVTQIPWGHNVMLLEKIKDPLERTWYVEQTIKEGWSRNVLAHQIDSELYTRQKHSIKSHNFTQTLSSEQSELAQQTLKDPYIFNFISDQGNIKERELQKSLTDRLKDFILEMGNGFAYMGSQYPLKVSEQDFYLDLLFFHYHLRCLVVVELKIGEFKPEYAGKMNFYLSALDDEVKHPDDNPSIGIILCRTKDKLIADYTLKDLNKPIGVSSYQLGTLPPEIQDSLPTVEQLEQALGDLEP
ncbi:MAG: PDDEXK nuclease domain-containing protein [Cyanobacteria bacterium P01_F01_bin.150]